MVWNRKRYDVVGSFLRPQELLEARKQHATDNLKDSELREIENKYIEQLIKEQLDLGYTNITDGEFRRTWWHLDFFWGLQGIEPVYDADTAERNFGSNVNYLKHNANGIKLTSKISGENHPFVEDYKFTKSTLEKYSDTAIARVVIPSPARLFYDFIDEQITIDNIHEHYDNLDQFKEDIIKSYNTVILDFYAAGARYIQLDDPIWITLVDDERFNHIFSYYDGDLSELKEQLSETYVALNNAVIEQAPKDITFATHNCRGNFRSRHASSGGYDQIANAAFNKQQFNVQYLEYDTERAGSFDALAEFDDETEVVLGLITSKTPTLEDKNDVVARIKEASQFISLDRLYLSPQCGFSSTEEGNLLTQDEQWAKLNWIKEIADEVWPDAETVNN